MPSNGRARLVSLIYEAALEPSRWPEFLLALADSIDGWSTQFLYHDVNGRSGTISTNIRLDPEARRKYEEHFGAIDPWLRSAKASRRLQPGVVHIGEHLVAHSDFVKTEYYADLARPYCISRTLAAVVRLDDTTVSSISSLRPDSREPFGTREQRLLEALIPHLQQALRIHRRIGSIESERASVIDALDRMPLGFILARANGTVILANRAARDILNLADGLQSVSGRLAAASPTENKVLQHWILTAAQAIDGIAGGCGGALSVSRPSLKTPLSVLITPIRSHASNELNDGRAAIFVADPEQAVTVRSEVLQDLWGLTAAEAVVASRIAAGQTVTEIAASLLVTNGTVRWHLKRVLAKTDTGRQPELVRVLATGPSTVRTAENSHNSRPSAAKR